MSVATIEKCPGEGIEGREEEATKRRSDGATKGLSAGVISARWEWSDAGETLSEPRQVWSGPSEPRQVWSGHSEPRQVWSGHSESDQPEQAYPPVVPPPLPSEGMGRQAPLSDEVVRRLRAKLEDHRRGRARQAGWTRGVAPMGLVRIDARLPGGGLPCGAITEILSDEPGAGSMTLAMRVAGKKARRHGGTEARREEGEKGAREEGTQGHRDEGTKQSFNDRRKIVVVDVRGDFYPPAAIGHGVALDRLIVIRTTNEQNAFWAVDQSLRCPGVALVIAPLRHLDERLSRRLQLAAESSGAIGLILRPAHPRIRSFAAVQMLVEAVGAIRAAGFSLRGDTEERAANTVGAPRRLKPAAQRNLDAQVSSPPFSSKRTGHACARADAADEVHLCRITLLKVREGMPAEPVLVDLHHEAGALPLHALPLERPSAKRA